MSTTATFAKDLKQELASRKLSTKGNKEELLLRLNVAKLTESKKEQSPQFVTPAGSFNPNESCLKLVQRAMNMTITLNT